MTSARTWTLGARITALCVITALTLAVIAAAAAPVAVTNRDNTERPLNRGAPLALNAQILLPHLVNHVSEIRWYALNSHPCVLPPYTQRVQDAATSVNN